MQEQPTPKEQISEAFRMKLDQELSTQPDLPPDQLRTFQNLSTRKALFLASLLSLSGVAAEASAERTFYPKPNIVKIEELPRGQRGDLDTLYRYGHQLERTLENLRTADLSETEEIGEGIIDQLTRIISFCDHQDIVPQKTFDLSDVPQNLIAQAEQNYSDAQRIAKGEKQKPPKKLASHEILDKKSL